MVVAELPSRLAYAQLARARTMSVVIIVAMLAVIGVSTAIWLWRIPSRDRPRPED